MYIPNPEELFFVGLCVFLLSVGAFLFCYGENKVLSDPRHECAECFNHCLFKEKIQDNHVKLCVKKCLDRFDERYVKVKNGQFDPKLMDIFLDSNVKKDAEPDPAPQVPQAEAAKPDENNRTEVQTVVNVKDAVPLAESSNPAEHNGTEIQTIASVSKFSKKASSQEVVSQVSSESKRLRRSLPIISSQQPMLTLSSPFNKPPPIFNEQELYYSSSHPFPQQYQSSKPRLPSQFLHIPPKPGLNIPQPYYLNNFNIPPPFNQDLTPSYFRNIPQSRTQIVPAYETIQQPFDPPFYRGSPSHVSPFNREPSLPYGQSLFRDSLYQFGQPLERESLPSFGQQPPLNNPSFDIREGGDFGYPHSSLQGHPLGGFINQPQMGSVPFENFDANVPNLPMPYQMAGLRRTFRPRRNQYGDNNGALLRPSVSAADHFEIVPPGPLNDEYFRLQPDAYEAPNSLPPFQFSSSGGFVPHRTGLYVDA